MKEHRSVLRFLLYSLGLCFGWFMLYDFWLSNFDGWLTLMVVDSSVYFLNLIGYNAEAKNVMVQIDGRDTVFVYHACNGMILMALFTGFILSFPGPFRKKLLFIPAGILVINMLNIIRVAALALNAYHYEQTLNFNHKYTFTLIVYAGIFFLWMLWVKRFSGLGKHVSKDEHKVKSQAASVY
ncbi:exosortase X [Pontibacter saemangeumensis]